MTRLMANEDPLNAEAADWFTRMREPSADERRAFEHWIGADPSHRAAYERLESQWRDMDILSQSLKARRELAAIPESPRKGPIYARWAIAATIVAGFLGLTSFSLIRWHDRSGEIVASAKPVSRPAIFDAGEGRRIVRLDDGSVITLDSGSRVETAFTATERRLRLVKGRARFNVWHDPARPFIVLAGRGQVTARGTVFDVRVSSDDRMNVILIRGTIDVQVDPQKARAAAIKRLSAGQTASIDPVAMAPVVSSIKPDVRWVSGPFDVDDLPVKTLLDEANQISAKKITADATILDQTIFGTFSIVDTRQLATNLAFAFRAHVEEDSAGNFHLSATGAPPRHPS